MFGNDIMLIPGIPDVEKPTIMPINRIIIAETSVILPNLLAIKNKIIIIRQIVAKI